MHTYNMGAITVTGVSERVYLPIIWVYGYADVRQVILWHQINNSYVFRRSLFIHMYVRCPHWLIILS